ncbi:MAG: hypothetical protein A3J30_02900 [Candidatus Wildermuthbacteria bacterium RIFCSPLOWO2_02_FULL_47_9c]|uniref:SET domain-containing protein n=2 Tax=Parcubacteria group TaxID=1794811 RepID=A0A837IM57_9BACT|nr:MAG: hypothetical protein UY25_C0005G0027 [Candidatus Yanofskybacteria bacterium GW2011_GWC1_48_11]KKW04049.1 MAG: hypothetical protein UY38_C0002G0203 [Parcubacteria group bacterium GW2011_GWB1_49_12]KKW08850.1 MAG: hypothetical protein UY45_C0003G0057 [Parcubacteria group bacterium GW2011_GWA1_49_26]KKW13835.1 MAG: hypothetical protein UY53_C0006G0020 [Parcubacteria group bacterium GW2011_GWA2_50_10]OHA61773.1 MAG: hypothetical protein A2109_00290 [Candidatus Wildermuthbacteria bacterium G
MSEPTRFTNEFSFILKPAKHGIGVFAVHDIAKGAYLRLFGDNKDDEHNTRLRNKKDVPPAFREYCADRGDTLWCPGDFGVMPIGWYLNHSKSPNAFHKNYHWYAAYDIAAGEEILIDYNTLEEPEEARKDYYKS